MRAARPPHPRTLASPATQRPPQNQHRQGQGRSPTRRQVPHRHQRPEPQHRRRRPRLQEPPRGRTRLPRPEVHPAAAPGLPPPRTPHPRPRAHLLAGPAPDPRRRTRQQPNLAKHQPATRTNPPGYPRRARRHRHPDHPTQPRAEGYLPGTFHPATGPDHRLRPHLNKIRNDRSDVDTRPYPALPAFAQLNPRFPGSRVTTNCGTRDLPEAERGWVDTKLGKIFANPDPAVGLRDAKALATALARKHPGAAASLREGLEEMFTVTRLGITGTLARTLTTSNPIESMISIAPYRQPQRH